MSSRSSRRTSQSGLPTDGSEPLMRTPLEVAARARKLDCVRTLLDTCVLKAHPDAPNKGYLTLAALADHPSALTLLLKVRARARACVCVCVCCLLYTSDAADDC